MIGVRLSGTLLASTFVLAAFAASSGLAQQKAKSEPISALKGHNSNAPVDVTADRIEVQDRADRAIFTGNVHVKQEDLTLDTPRLTVAYVSGQANGGNVQIKRLDAADGVIVRSPTEVAKGDFGVYDLDRKLITLIGNVQLNREQNQVNGSRLTIDLNSGRAVVDGGPPGVNQSGGRVSGHFTVPQHQNQKQQ
jgi:lipopolysaccharide export system protein LptA